MSSHRSAGAREPLTKEKIIEKAIELLAAEGPDGLRMRRLGEALGVEAMALYHHFPNKDAILDGVVRRVVTQAGPARLEQDADWKLEMLCGPGAGDQALEAHGEAGWFVLGRGYTTAASLQLLEAPLALLHSAGFRGRQLVDAAHAIFACAAGWYALASGRAGTWSGPTEEAIAVIAGAVAEDFPLVTSLAPQLRDWSSGFDEGMLALLEGLEGKLGGKRPA